MKTKLLLLLLVISSLAYSQKCKYDSEEKDPFTGKSTKKIITVMKGLGAGASEMIFRAEDKSYFMGLTISLSGRYDISIAKGDTLSIALGDGSMLSFVTTDAYVPNTQANPYAIFTYYRPQFSISQQQLSKLESTNILATKIKLGSLPIIINVEEKCTKRIRKAAGCIVL